MSVGSAIFGKLTGDCAAVTDTDLIAAAALVATLIEDRIIPLRAFQKQAIPLVAYQIDTSNYDKTYNGPSGLSSHEVTVACIADDFDGAEQLAGAVVTVLNSRKTAAIGTDARYELWGDQLVNTCVVDDVGDAEEFTIESGAKAIRKDIHITIWLGT